MQHTRRRTIFRRRLSATTDYRRRLRLLKSGMPRAVVRVSNTRTTAQITSYHKDGDVVVATVTGSDLSSRDGGPADLSQKSVPASYLVGFALGKAALAAGHDEAVLDIGLAASTPGNRVYAALRGMVDAGLEVPHGEDVLPDDDRVNGAHIDESIADKVEACRTTIEEAY